MSGVSRPVRVRVSEQEELDRVLPVIEAVVDAVDVPVSIDTSKPAVMRAAVGAGAAMINDIRALREDGALEAAVELQRPVCLASGLPDAYAGSAADHAAPAWLW
jgi:dihydropteroate synthase